MLVIVESKAGRSSKAVTVCSVKVGTVEEFKVLWGKISRVFAEYQDSPLSVFNKIQNVGFQGFVHSSKLPKSGEIYLRLRVEDEKCPDLLTGAYHISLLGDTYVSEMVSVTDDYSFCRWPFDLVQLIVINSRKNPENWEIRMLDMDDTCLVKEFSVFDEAMEIFELLVENGVSWEVMKDFNFIMDN